VTALSGGDCYGRRYALAIYIGLVVLHSQALVDTVVEDVEDTHPTPTFVRLIRSYLALEFTAGHILLPTLLSIFLFSRRCHRHPTLINVIIALIWASVLSSLL
jgi:hypothetical protein